MSRRVWILLVWAMWGIGVAHGASAQAPRALDTQQLFVHRVQWEGPVDSLEFSFGSKGATTCRATVLAGETKSELLPFVQPWPAPGDRDDAQSGDPPRVQISGAGRMIGVPELLSEAQPEAFGAPAWVMPYLPPTVPVLPTAVRWLFLGWGLGLWFLRRKVLGLWAASTACAALLLLFVPPGYGVASHTVRVLDRVPGQPLQVFDCARDRLAVDVARRPRVVVEPRGRLHWRGELGPGSDLEWTAEQTGALLRAQYAADLGPRALESDLNSLGEVLELWVRTNTGLWEWRGPWGLGEAMPTKALDGPDPPAWLIAGLPQGVDVWLARLGSGTFSGGLSMEPFEVWVRWRLP